MIQSKKTFIQFYKVSKLVFWRLIELSSIGLLVHKMSNVFYLPYVMQSLSEFIAVPTTSVIHKVML